MINPDVAECPECGYRPGGIKYKIGTAVQLTGVIVLLYGIYELVTLFTSDVAQYASGGMMAGFTAVVAVIFIVTAGVLIGGGWWAKRSASNDSPVL